MQGAGCRVQARRSLFAVWTRSSSCRNQGHLPSLLTHHRPASGTTGPPHISGTCDFSKVAVPAAPTLQGLLPQGRPPWRQPRGKWMVSLVNSHTNTTSKRWHLWENGRRFALNSSYSTPGWRLKPRNPEWLQRDPPRTNQGPFVPFNLISAQDRRCPAFSGVQSL